MARKLTKLEKFGLIAAVITGMLFFYLKHVYDPQQRALVRAREQLNRSITQLNEMQAAEQPFQLRRRLESQRETLAELEQELNVLDIRVGDEEALIRAQHWAYQEMERRNLRVLNVVPQSEVKKFFTWRVFRVTAEGDFAGFIALLRDLRSHSTPMLVEQVSISREDKPWVLRIVMDLWIMG
ncbi:hypothetical protein [Desulfonatronum thiodismutans]|uniref:hypothetical protein n=1 Tax=Desulfonatronum thiodismutans TaxID=159290 RepID=UPI0004ABD846|nr:hypothetical protein [Desulfonatronum thiodismutans]